MLKRCLKDILKNILGIPTEWIVYYFKQAKRLYNNSSSSLNKNNIEWIVTKIKILTHELDKGLHMPEPKKGFGREKSKLLIDYLNRYVAFDDMDYEYDAYLDAIEILQKYCESKDLYGLETDHIVLEKYKLDYKKAPNRISETGKFKGEIDVKNLNFRDFASSRHSIRYYKDNYTVDEHIFEKAIEIARLCPSACNRQSSRVLLINNMELANKVLEIQGGARGFKNANNCVLIMSDLNSYWYDGEMNTAFIDSGIFTMNLIYALKYYNIDCCPLIWDDNSYRREAIDELLDIPKNYYIMCVLSLGEADSRAKTLDSPRKEIDNIIMKVRRK